LLHKKFELAIDQHRAQQVGVVLGAFHHPYFSIPQCLMERVAKAELAGFEGEQIDDGTVANAFKVSSA
jgi:hypothetical protein